MNLKNALIIFGLGVMIAIAGFLNVSKETKETKAETVEVATETMITETNYTYVICDVVDSYGDCPEDIYATNLVCKMPDGTLHKYIIEDAPEGKVELVCFRTTNQDNYEAYEVVAVR